MRRFDEVPLAGKGKARLSANLFILFFVYAFRQFFKRSTEHVNYFYDIIQRRLNLIAFPLADSLLGGIHFPIKIILTDFIKLSQILQITAKRTHKFNLHYKSCFYLTYTKFSVILN